MKLKSLGIEGAWLAESTVWTDDRGSFYEWYKFYEIKEFTGLDFSVKQANVSVNSKGVVRGIHYSLAIGGQAKWISCIKGHILDVIVDLRPNSPTFKQWCSTNLQGHDGNSVLVGKDLGHAFISLEEGSIVAYLSSSIYSPNDEFEINPLDPELGIEWGVPRDELTLSPKDFAAPNLIDRLKQGKLPL
jgi:dTDP-4-dehydrorhamnose 3,5-epimerase